MFPPTNTNYIAFHVLSYIFQISLGVWPFSDLYLILLKSSTKQIFEKYLHMYNLSSFYDLYLWSIIIIIHATNKLWEISAFSCIFWMVWIVLLPPVFRAVCGCGVPSSFCVHLLPPSFHGNVSISSMSIYLSRTINRTDFAHNIKIIIGEIYCVSK